MQSDIELVISRFSEIEKRLVDDLGATEKKGRLRTSFTDKLGEVQHLLVPDIISRMRMIAALRNKLAHGEITTIPNKNRFLRDCDYIHLGIDVAKKRISPSRHHYRTVAVEPAFSSDRLDFSEDYNPLKPFKKQIQIGLFIFISIMLAMIWFGSSVSQTQTVAPQNMPSQTEWIDVPIPQNEPTKTRNSAKIKKKSTRKKAKNEKPFEQNIPNIATETQDILK